jgi:sulfur carrier protein
MTHARPTGSAAQRTALPYNLHSFAVRSASRGYDVKIRLNGEPADVPDAVTIEQLLERLGVDPRRVAVEHNLTIIKRHRQAETVVNEGDEVEIVNFVGGG